MMDGVFFTKPRRRKLPPTPEPHLYRAFLTHVFNFPMGSYYSANWNWDEEIKDDPYHEIADNSPVEVVNLYLHLLPRMGTDLATFSIEQVATGIHYLFSPYGIEWVLFDRAVALEDRCAVIRAMSYVYDDVFDHRCARVMSHLDPPGENTMNSICYMLWDVSSLSHFRVDGRLSPSVRTEAMPEAEAVFSVIEGALYSENIASVESGLHGLGHMASDWPKEVEAIIDLYQRRRPNHDPRLLHYADLARVGLVQ
jgi:hypothetical protein